MMSFGFHPHRSLVGMLSSKSLILATLLTVLSTHPALAWVGTARSTTVLPPSQELKQSPWGQLATASQSVQANQPMAAINPLLNATEHDPKNVLAHYLLADVAAQLGRQQDDTSLKAYWQGMAGDYYEKTICLNPGVLSATLKLGKMAIENKHYDEAEQHYLNALRMLPDNAALHYNLANVYDEQQRIDKAIEHYEQTVALDPNFLYAYNNLGLLYEISDKLGPAQKAFETALAKDPTYNFARLNLGQLHLKQGNLKTAEGLFHEALKYEPDNAWAYVYLGNLYVQQHQFDHAASAYQSAIRYQPDYTPTYYLMAAVLEKLGRWNESAALGAQYLEKAPNGVYASQAKQLLAYVHTQSQVAVLPNDGTAKEDLVPSKPSAVPSGDGVARGYVQAP